MREEMPGAPGSGTGDAGEIYKDGSYLRNNESWHVEDSPWKARQIRAMLERNGVRPASVCEVGCGAGEILRQLSTAFPDSRFVGYELSPQAFELCKPRATGKVSYFQRNLLDEDVFFDCLLCIDVFEHVEDYLGFVRALRDKAAFKVFHIPLDLSALAVLRSEMMETRQSIGHLHYFSRDTALATLRDCGYEIVDEAYTPWFIDFPSSTGRLAGLVRRALFGIAPHFTVRLAGGCSLLVLAK